MVKTTAHTLELCLQHDVRRQVWDSAKLEGVKSFRTTYTVESASYCADRGRFAAGGDDMWVHLHDFATGEELEVNRGVGFRSPACGPVHEAQSRRNWLVFLISTGGAL